MKRQLYLILFQTVFAVHVTAGTRFDTIMKGRKIDPIRVEEQNRGHDQASQSYQRQSDTRYSDGNYESSASLIIDEFIDNQMDTHAPDNLKIKVHGQVSHENPTESQDLVELMEGTGVMISKNDLHSTIKKCGNFPGCLTRTLIDLLISREELLTMRATSRYGHTSVPENIRNAIETFVQSRLTYQINHRKFLRFISSHLANLRRTEIRNRVDSDEPSISQSPGNPVQNKIVTSHSLVENLPEHMGTMVELVKGSGVKMNKNKLDILNRTYRENSKFLMRNLFHELIPRKELSYLRASDKRGYKHIPNIIRDAVEIYVRENAEPKLSHSEFMSSLSGHLLYLRNAAEKMKKIDAKKNTI